MKAHIPDYPAENANLRDLAHFIREFTGHNLPGLGAAGPILNAALDHLELQQAWHDLNVSRAETRDGGEGMSDEIQIICPHGFEVVDVRINSTPSFLRTTHTPPGCGYDIQSWYAGGIPDGAVVRYELRPRQ